MNWWGLGVHVEIDCLFRTVAKLASVLDYVEVAESLGEASIVKLVI